MVNHVDPERLRTVLATELGPCSEFGVDSFGGGQSRTQAIVDWDDDRFVVVFGKQSDEWHLLHALTSTSVAVPEPVVHIEDDRVPGDSRELFVRQHVPGETVYRTEPDWLATPTARRTVSRRIVETLGTVHTIDVEQFRANSPPIYSASEVLSRLRATVENLANSHEDRSYRRIRQIGSWLEQRVPEPVRPHLVHGDLKLDNVVVGLTESSTVSVRAIIDWEHSFFGDPRIDLGYLLVHWWDDCMDPVVPSAILPRITGRDGYPSRYRLLKWYELSTGRSFDERRFFLVLALFQLACACEIIYQRGSDDRTTDVDETTLERGLPTLVKRANRFVDGEETV